jgi:hypothetical protein
MIWVLVFVVSWAATGPAVSITPAKSRSPAHWKLREWGKFLGLVSGLDGPVRGWFPS